MHNEMKIAHRDIKPENIYYLSDVNRVKVGDFTLAMLCESEDVVVHEEAGSVPFMPPESFTGEPYKPKPMDIWALAMTIYCFVALENPIFKNDMNAMKENIRSKEIEYPETFSDDLKDLLRKMLNRDPTQRISIKEVIEHKWFQEPEEEPNLGAF